MDPVDQRAFVIGLAKLDLEAEASGSIPAELFDVGEGSAAIGLWLAPTEQIHIGAVKDVKGFRHFVSQDKAGSCALLRLARAL